MHSPLHLPTPQGAISHFIRAIFKRKVVFIEAMVGTFVVNMISLATSMYSMQVYDRVIPTGGMQTLWVLTAGVMIAVVLELLIRQVRAVMVDKACKAIDVELSDFFFGRALNIRLDRRPRTIGTFAAQVRMFESVRTFLTSTTLFVLADMPFALIFVGVIAMLAGSVALVPLILLPVSIITGLIFTRPIERLTNINVAESNFKNGLLIESIDGVETIKTIKGEPAFLARWHALTLKIGEGELSLKSLSNLSSGLTQAIQQVSYVGLVASGVYAITSGNLTMGGLIACSIISGRALSPIAQISGLLIQWQHAKAALKGLDGILQMPADGEIEGGGKLVKPESCEAELRVEEVQFAYEQQQEVIQIPALQIKPGERVAIIGPIGSGKSTLLKLLSGLYRPGKGRVFLGGVDMAHLDPEFTRSNVHYLPQDARLFNGTLRENLVLGLPGDPGDDVILAAAKATGLDRIIQQHPRGLGLVISEGGQGLSGGQRQLVTITRMLLSRRSVLLLDEPTASIDGPLEEVVARSVFANLTPADTVVIVTHKTSLLRFINRIIVIDKGKMVLDGPRDAVLARLAQQQRPQGEAAAPAPTAPPASPQQTETEKPQGADND